MIKFLPCRLLATLSLLLCASFAQAQIDSAAAENLMRKTGLWEQIASTERQVQAGIAAAAAKPGSTLAPAQLQEATRTASLAFAPDRMRASALQVVSQKVSPANLPSMKAWYDSPTGRKITELEEAAAGRDPNAMMRDGAAQLRAMAPGRRATLAQIVTVTRAPEAATTMIFNTGLAIQQGMLSASPGATGPSPQQLRQQLEAQRPRLMQAMENMALAGFALTYATLPDDQLAQYVAFMRTPAGQQITDVGMLAFSQAMADSAKEWGKLLAPLRKQPKP